MCLCICVCVYVFLFLIHLSVLLTNSLCKAHAPYKIRYTHVQMHAPSKIYFTIWRLSLQNDLVCLKQVI